MSGETHWEGEPVRVWREVWDVPRFEAWESLGSTNDRIRELAAAGAPAFTVVTADRQTAGRGRSGRRWESPPGAGLWISFLVDAGAPGGARPLPLLVGMAAARALERVGWPEADAPVLGVKWPNDVVSGGRKLCGVLCEGLPGGRVAVGVGANLRQRPGDFPPELRPRATSLEAASGRSVSRPAVAGALLAEARRLLGPEGPDRIAGAVADELRRRDALRGLRVRAEGAGEPFEGLAAGVDTSGALLLRSGGAERRVVAGSVRVVGEGRPEPSGRA